MASWMSKPGISMAIRYLQVLDAVLNGSGCHCTHVNQGPTGCEGVGSLHCFCTHLACFHFCNVQGWPVWWVLQKSDENTEDSNVKSLTLVTYQIGKGQYLLEPPTSANLNGIGEFHKQSPVMSGCVLNDLALYLHWTLNWKELLIDSSVTECFV